MNPNEYLNNPVISKNFYNVKCVDIEVIDGFNLPTIIVVLRIIPYEPYGAAQNVVLHATLRDTSAAQQMHERFRETFRVGERPEEAVGRFGAVLIDVSEFKGRRYSAVHFIRQNDIVRRNCAALERADRAGEIPWAA